MALELLMVKGRPIKNRENKFYICIYYIITFMSVCFLLNQKIVDTSVLL